MRIFITVIIAFFATGTTFGNDSLIVRFEKVKDTVFTNSNESFYTAKVKIPKQPTFLGAKITLAVDADKTNVSDIMVPNNLSYTIKDTSQDLEATFKIGFKRSTSHDRLMVLKLSAQNVKGENLPLKEKNSMEAEIYIKPRYELENADNEYWFFIGTNFDLLDGIKAKDLYFRGSFLIPWNNEHPRKRQWYITFEKNRFFTERDSLYRIPFSDLIFKPGQDDSLITIAKGQYSSFRETVTENIGFSLNYLQNLKTVYKSDRYNFYAMGGFYIDYQTKTFNYTNHSILSDTSTKERIKDSTYIFRPLLAKDRIQYWNGNIYVGGMYIHSGNTVNLKTYLQIGINLLRFPTARIKTSTNDLTQYGINKNLYIRYHLDATLLESPGISIGAEVYLRKGEMPLFNFTLTKVFDYRNLKNFFDKVPSQ